MSVASEIGAAKTPSPEEILARARDLMPVMRETLPKAAEAGLRHGGDIAPPSSIPAGKLSQIGQPVLVLNPDDDLAEQTPRAEVLLRSGQVRHLPGYFHGMLDIHTDEIGRILREFLGEG